MHSMRVVFFTLGHSSHNKQEYHPEKNPKILQNGRFYLRAKITALLRTKPRLAQRPAEKVQDHIFLSTFFYTLR